MSRPPARSAAERLFDADITRLSMILHDSSPTDASVLPPKERRAAFLKRLLTHPSVYVTAPKTEETELRRVVVTDLLRRYGELPPALARGDNPLMVRDRPELAEIVLQGVLAYLPALVTEPMYPTPMRYPATPVVRDAALASLRREGKCRTYEDALYVSLADGRANEARHYLWALLDDSVYGDPPIVWNSHRALQEAIVNNDAKLFDRIAAAFRRQAFGKPVANARAFWVWTGTSFLHLAILYRRPGMTKTLLDPAFGQDPRLPFVYDGAPRSLTKTLKERRVVVPTLDLVDRAFSPAIARGLHPLIRSAATRSRREPGKDASRRSHASRLRNWTGKTYRKVQERRRGAMPRPLGARVGKAVKTLFSGRPKYEAWNLTKGLDPATSSTRPESVNQALAKHMKNHALRAPAMPRAYSWQNGPRPPTTLFRGVHGPIARQLRAKGRYVDKGYVAVSTRETTAGHFRGRRGGLVLRFPVSSIPRGTPWIWFDPEAQKQSGASTSWMDEGEVLLPPGAYTLGRRIDRGVYEARYEPDRTATSLSGRRMFAA